MTIAVHGPASLPDNDNVPDNPYAYSLEITKPWFMSKGAMIAFYGSLQFVAVRGRGLSGLIFHMVTSQFSSPLYAQDWVVAEGHGKLVLGDRGFEINSYDLDDGNLTIKASNLLAFEGSLALQQSIVPGYLTLIGTGKFLASSSGAVMFAEPPLRVDPEALLGWADCPAPSHRYDSGWMAGFLGSAMVMMGTSSGEERQFDFTGSGTVLIQSSEAVRSDRDIVQLVESHLPLVGPAGLQRLQQSIQQRLAQQSP